MSFVILRRRRRSQCEDTSEEITRKAASRFHYSNTKERKISLPVDFICEALDLSPAGAGGVGDLNEHNFAAPLRVRI